MTRDETIRLFMECEAKCAEKHAASLAEGKSEEEAEVAAVRAAAHHWNSWAKKLLAERKALEEANQWAMSASSVAGNPETRAWTVSAKADFSHCHFIMGDGNTAEDGLEVIQEQSETGELPLITIQLNADTIRFRGFIFPGGVTFSNTTFSKPVDFDGVEFLGMGLFSRVTFSESADFHCAVFSDGASFKNASFSEYANFRKVSISESAGFENAKFSKGVGFKDANVGSYTGCFDQATFSGRADFDNATFTGTAMFDCATFFGRAEFNNTRFFCWASFSEAKFLAGARFNFAKFFDKAKFERVKIPRDISFDGVTFDKAVSFNRVEFSGDVSFEEATFKGPLLFKLARFIQVASFENARFEGPANFEAIRGERSFNMASAVFETVPDFIQAHFEEAPRLDNLYVKAQEGLELLTEKEARNLFARWRALKRLAIEACDTDRELEFNAQEIQAERASTRWPLPRRVRGWKNWRRSFSGWLYDLFSDYGRSLLRPFGAWFGAMVFFAAFYLSQTEVIQRDLALKDTWWGTAAAQAGYALSRKIPCYPPPPTYTEGWRAKWRMWDKPRMAAAANSNETLIGGLSEKVRNQTNARADALHLAFRNAFVVLDGGSDASHRMYGCLYGLELYAGQNPVPIVPSAVSTASAIQKLISGVLIFLFGLALRNMLKVK